MPLNKHLITSTFLLILFAIANTVNAAPTREEILKEIFSEGITVDLRDPVYSDGVLTTETGGVIAGPNLRIQAMKICYTRKKVEDKPVFTIAAEGNLMVEYGDYIIVGDSLEYDFQAQEGVITNGRSAVVPWYFGGETIELLSDGSLLIHNGFITTSDNENPDWEIRVATAHISEDHLLNAKRVQIQILKLPVFWVPSIHANLDWVLDSPLRYRVRWGGTQGLRAGIIYELFSWRNLKTFLRFDYRFNRGPGGGIETEYESPDGNEKSYTISYIARDSSIEEPSERTRYRFAGVYSNNIDCGKLMIDLSYDKLSDKEMASDYYDKSLDLKTAGRTQLCVRRQYNDTAILNFFTRVRANDFQTVKQELPVVTSSLHPKVLGSSGIISENLVKIGYLDFKYSDDQLNIIPPNFQGNSDTPTVLTDYHSTRLEARHQLYRPIPLGPVILTPNAKALMIFYGSSQAHDAKWLGIASVGAEAKTQLYRFYGNRKHIIEPYFQYQYFPKPTVSPNNHFIFDIQDGWYGLNTLRFGMRNLAYINCPLIRNLTTDIYSYSFFDTPTLLKPIPKIYGLLLWDVTPSLRQSFKGAWDFEREIVDHVNFRTDYTFNENLAVAAEYRHRSAWAWRKSQPYNFMMESFQTEQSLKNSLVSDRRNTFLFHVFYRFLPNWALEYQLRKGWNREFEPNYREYQIDLMTTLRSKWDLRLSYQQREDDHRVALYISLNTDKPDAPCCPGMR